LIPQQTVVPLVHGQASAASDWTRETICFSFKQLDRRQGQEWGHWQQAGLLTKLCEALVDYSRCTYIELVGKDQRRFHVYGDFPSKSDFHHPRHVPKDASWASMHVTKKSCVCGHFIHNVFYVVFLDEDHRFFITKNPANN